MMRKFVLQVGNQKISITNQGLVQAKNKQWDIFANLAHRVGFVAVLALCVLLPLQAILYPVDFDSYQVYTMLVVAMVSLAAWAIVSWVLGTKFIVDPPLFVSVLLFALLSTTAYLLSPADLLNPGSALNTFGREGERGIAAIGVLLVLSIYYFGNSFLFSSKRLGMLIKGLIYVPSLVLILAAVMSILRIGGFAYLSIAFLAVLWVPVGAVFYLLRPSRALFRVVHLLAVLASLYILQGLLIQMALVLLAVVIAVIWWQRKVNLLIEIKSLRRVVTQVFAGKLSLKELNANTYMLQLLLLALALGVILLTQARASDFVPYISSLWTSTVEVFKLNAASLQSLLFGTGFGRVVTQDGSTFTQIISAQGIVGMLGYIVVSISAVTFAWPAAKQALAGKGDMYRLGLWLVLILVPLVAVISTPPTLLIALWWLVVTAFTAEKLILTRKLNLATATWRPRFRYLKVAWPWLQLLVIGIVLWVLILGLRLAYTMLVTQVL